MIPPITLCKPTGEAIGQVSLPEIPEAIVWENRVFVHRSLFAPDVFIEVRPVFVDPDLVELYP